ncbi:alternative ribosome rescue aminoacyl-tRNA hydrolase ArfB [Anditalea andensis]|nr:alternative ribosome rescue aminoacyl-tRNA hydrolase ArfB [Anditalea andensis]
MSHPIQYRGLESEMDFEVSRSSGPGGQNVNKVNSRVTLRFNVTGSVLLDDQEKAVLFKKLSLTASGDLLISSQASRSQLKNKEACKERFYDILREAFKKKKVRRVTRPTKSSQRKRLDEKKKQGEKKRWRGEVDY